ncbi:hypothetical protein [Hyperthermus butylicus]|uniref:Uncharacterized protein n=1 Tax=Hyperthermus butylicus (strain DSM 5456 / JCM 9403 / PLM1-5) TaxID=415426 RepID=A2BJI1_HYPBU|nr:hypothetical protein [Hyperthermus butylicus]ABM80142.1 hypothetical protein Hbut_0270 [Hyperthermus butylicus DSM 5456]
MSVEGETRPRIALIEPEPGAIAREELLEERVAKTERRLREVWEGLEKVEKEVEEFSGVLRLFEGRVAGLEEFKRAAEMVGSWKLQTCIYQSRGICILWRLSREAAERLGMDIVVEDEGIYRVKVSAAPWFCALCPLYQRNA